MKIDVAPFKNLSGIMRAARRALGLLKPPPDLPPSQWAEEHVRIPAGNAVPGPYRIANAPIQREPMDMFVDPDCYRVSLMWGAQIGKTTCALCVQGYAIDMRPRSQMMMQPSRDDVTTWLETKFNPLVEASPSIARRIAKPRGRDGVNNQRMKSYIGGFLMLAWSGSPRTMRGRSAPLIVCDEVDGYLRTPEGHPVGLLWQRAATFGDERFLFEISTPTIEDGSHIAEAFEAGDQRRFYVRCPCCGELQVLKWENVTWIGRQSTGIKDALDDLKHDDHKPETARYACESCGEVWNDGQRIHAIRTAEADGGGWIAAKPFRGHASYHAWEAYSTLRKLADIVRDYLDKLKTDDLQTFVNVSLSQTWAEPGAKADPSALEARAEDFPAQVPMGGVYLTAGIDMQMDRLEVEVVAWGVGEESWSVEYRVLWGDPLAGEVWQDLDELLAGAYMHESGVRLPISAACMDTGGTDGYTQAAYEYLRGKTGRRLFGIKGVSGWGKPIVEKMQRKQSGKNARKVDLFLVAVDEGKKVVMRRLALQKGEDGKAPPGYCHIPRDRDIENGGMTLAEWCQQITAEKLLTRYVKGQPIREWVKHPKARNEALDCRVYATAALKIMQPPLRRLKEKLLARASANSEASASPEPPRATPKPAPVRKPKVEPAPEIRAASNKRQPPENPSETKPRRRVVASPAARRSNWVSGWKQ